MRLADREIHRLLEDGELVVLGPIAELPFDPISQVQPGSIDLRLDNHFLRFKEGVEVFDVHSLDCVWDFFERFEVQKDEYIELAPREILFSQIYEQLRLPPTTSGMIEGRSRIARLGIAVHATGGYINPLFEGAMPLQIINHNHIPVRIYPFIPVCQLILNTLTSEPLIPYPQRSNNPYYKERHAGPTVIQSDPIVTGSEVFPMHHEVEKRLVLKYLRDRQPVNERVVLEGASRPEISLVLNNSHVGSILTAHLAQNIKSTLHNMRAENSKEDIVEKLRVITEAALSTSEIQFQDQRAEFLELMDGLSSQVARSTEEQAPKGFIATVLGRLDTLAAHVIKESSLWEDAYKYLKIYFGFISP